MYNKRFDELEKFLFIIYIIISFINIFCKIFILSIILLILLIIICVRYFSKNSNKREKENETYLLIIYKTKKLINDAIMHIKDPNYVYKRCHKCRCILRFKVPSKRGIKKYKCIKCSHKNNYIVLKKIKVEIIRKKQG